ncbi:MAG: hypothetical protein WC713_10075 [Candidatus Methylomirabilota bacterium]
MEKRGKTNKKGQMMGMPFQFIFSMILIAVVLFVAIWAIKGFMERAEQAKIGAFVADVRSNVYNVWNSGTAANFTPVISFSAKFKEVCFVNLSTCSDAFCKAAREHGYSDENLFLLGENRAMGIAEKYGISSGVKIMCGDRDCLLLKKTVCYSVEGGKVALGIYTGGGCAPGKVCIF